jgi:hypothetical protein
LPSGSPCLHHRQELIGLLLLHRRVGDVALHGSCCVIRRHCHVDSSSSVIPCSRPRQELIGLLLLHRRVGDAALHGAARFGGLEARVAADAGRRRRRGGGAACARQGGTLMRVRVPGNEERSGKLQLTLYHQASS